MNWRLFEINWPCALDASNGSVCLLRTTLNTRQSELRGIAENYAQRPRIFRV